MCAYSPSRCQQHQVLVVEDHDDTREMVKMFLELDGFAVSTAVHGRDALECLRHNFPCIILLDATMPVMDGLEFGRLLRLHPNPAIAHIPIILLTALPSDDAEKVRQVTGAVKVIPKPRSFPVVVAAVHRYCGKQPEAPDDRSDASAF